MENSNQLLLIPLSVVLTIFLIVAAMPVFTLFWLYRVCVIKLAKWTRPDLESIVSNFDVVFTALPYNLLVVFKIDGELSRERMIELFQTRLLDLKDENGNNPYKRLKQTFRPFMGYCFWADDQNFKLQNHINYYSEDINLNSNHDNKLNDIVTTIIKAPWKSNQSQWEVLLLRNEDASETTVLLRLEHSLGDGYSIHGIFRNLCETPCTLPRIARNNPKFSVMDRLRIVCKAPMEILGAAGEIYDHWGKPRKVKSSTDYYCTTPPISVARIKAIKEKFGVGFAAVIFSALEGAIAKYLIDSGETVPEVLLTGIPLPLPNHPDRMCNHIIGLAINLPSRASDVVARLHDTEDRLLCLKESVFTIMNVPLAKLVSCAPALFIQYFFSYIPLPNYIVSINPVTLKKDTLNGLRCTDLMASAYSDYHGLTTFACGVNNSMRVSFLANRNFAGSNEETERFGNYFLEELIKLESL